PLLRPVAGFLLVWLTINALQLFDEVYVTTKGGPLHATTVIVYYLYQQAFQFFHAGYAAAIAVVLFFVIIVITLVQRRIGRDPSSVGEHGCRPPPTYADPRRLGAARGVGGCPHRGTWCSSRWRR